MLLMQPSNKYILIEISRMMLANYSNQLRLKEINIYIYLRRLVVTNKFKICLIFIYLGVISFDKRYQTRKMHT